MCAAKHLIIVYYPNKHTHSQNVRSEINDERERDYHVARYLCSCGRFNRTLVFFLLILIIISTAFVRGVDTIFKCFVAMS